MGKIFKALEKSQQNLSETEGVMPPENYEDESGESAVQVETPAQTAKKTAPAESSEVSELRKIHEEEAVKDRGEIEMTTLDSSLVAALRPHSLAAEQFRILKNTLLFPDEGDPPKTIMVTSAAPDEGKSFVSTNLAASIAGSIDEYVLLMDCDLRLPSVHSRFGYKDYPPGLSEYLTRGTPLADILLKTTIGKLTILPGGSPPDNPSELVSSEQMRRLLDEVKNRYKDRYVIIDSPPPNFTSEAAALARQVDGIIIVIKNGQTKKGDVQDVIDSYGRKKILGVVKNFAPVKSGYVYKKGYIYQSHNSR